MRKLVRLLALFAFAVALGVYIVPSASAQEKSAAEKPQSQDAYRKVMSQVNIRSPEKMGRPMGFAAKL